MLSLAVVCSPAFPDFEFPTRACTFLRCPGAWRPMVPAFELKIWIGSTYCGFCYLFTHICGISCKPMYKSSKVCRSSDSQNGRADTRLYPSLQKGRPIQALEYYKYSIWQFLTC